MENKTKETLAVIIFILIIIILVVTVLYAWLFQKGIFAPTSVAGEYYTSGATALDSRTTLA